MGMFDDMMSSSRGPGVIGTLMALVVIIGFGTLYFFVFDEGMRGGDKSIESVIRDNAKDLDNLKTQIENRKKSLEGAPELSRIAAEVEKVSSDTRRSSGGIEGQTNLIAKIQKEIEDTRTDFAEYKQAYREQMREKGKGVSYPELKVGSETYLDAVVKNVDAIGIQFSHSTGSKRVNFIDLTPEIREYFQYDPDEAAQLEKAKTKIEITHNTAVAAANVKNEANRLAEEAKRRAEAVKKAEGDINAQTAIIKSLDKQINDAQSQMAAERQTKALVNRAKYDNIIRAAQNDKSVAQDRLNAARNDLKKNLAE